jgi:hypothetical protein
LFDLKDPSDIIGEVCDTESELSLEERKGELRGDDDDI